MLFLLGFWAGSGSVLEKNLDPYKTYTDPKHWLWYPQSWNNLLYRYLFQLDVSSVEDYKKLREYEKETFEKMVSQVP